MFCKEGFAWVKGCFGVIPFTVWLFMTCAQICIHDRISTVMLQSRQAGFWVLQSILMLNMCLFLRVAEAYNLGQKVLDQWKITNLLCVYVFAC